MINEYTIPFLLVVVFVLFLAVLIVLAQAVETIKLPVKEALSLRKHPLGSLSAEDARLGLGRISRSAATICTLGAVSYAILVVVYLVTFIFALFANNGEPNADMLKPLFLDASGASRLPNFIELVMLVPVFVLLRQFFGGIGSTGRPFELERAKELSQVGALMLWMGVLAGPVGNLLTWLFSMWMGFEFSVENIGQVALPAFILGIFAFLFARVFEYGCILQQEDDGLV